jgi:hypothetical protein
MQRMTYLQVSYNNSNSELEYRRVLWTGAEYAKVPHDDVYMTYSNVPVELYGSVYTEHRWYIEVTREAQWANVVDTFSKCKKNSAVFVQSTLAAIPPHIRKLTTKITRTCDDGNGAHIEKGKVC